MDMEGSGTLQMIRRAEEAITAPCDLPFRLTRLDHPCKRAIDEENLAKTVRLGLKIPPESSVGDHYAADDEVDLDVDVQHCCGNSLVSFQNMAGEFRMHVLLGYTADM